MSDELNKAKQGLARTEAKFNKMSAKKRGAGKMPKAPKGYVNGGSVQGAKRGIMPTNQTTVKARGAGAAARGTNFKV